jgi:hypothetical protein
MAKFVHSDVLDGGLNAIKNAAIRVLLVNGYTVGDSYATVVGNMLAQATMASGDYTLASSGNNRTLTTATKNSTATAAQADIVSTRSATAGSTTTLTDSTQAWTVNAFANKVVTIVAGTGAGQSAIITSNTTTALTFPALSTAPDATSTYRVNNNLYLAYCDNVSKVLMVTDETSNIAVGSGDTVNFPSIVYTNVQPT